MKLTAHKTVAMFMRYVHTEDKPVREAAELVASRRQTITGANAQLLRRRRHDQAQGHPSRRLQRLRRCWATFGH
jgi:hypothetical protein